MHVFPSSVEIIKLSIVMALELRSCEFNAKTLADELGSIAKWHDQKQNACIAIWINMLIIFWEHGYSSASNLNMYHVCSLLSSMKTTQWSWRLTRMMNMNSLVICRWLSYLLHLFIHKENNFGFDSKLKSQLGSISYISIDRKCVFPTTK